MVHKKSSVKKGIPIVGVGASAGGLDAFKELFSGMSASTGMAFVLVPHLDPTHVSVLPELIQRLTEMKVHVIENGMKAEPNNIYITPPSKEIAILDGKFQLMEPAAAQHLRLPINYFFNSLARDQKENATGIILSGTGTDGTDGFRAIKSFRGLTIAEDPKLSKYDGMPRNAIAENVVDCILDPRDMAGKLIEYYKGVRPKNDRCPADEGISNAIQKICVLLKNHTGHDFSFYKQSTIHRRIERRMNLHQISSYDNYAVYLQEQPSEIDNLFKELLIGVTGFFRDCKMFDVLKKRILEKYLAGKKDGSMRVWVPGCSTGEEPYSIAIILQELATELKTRPKIQIFATDIDNDALNTARAGLYPAGIVADVGSERLKQFFTKEEGGYRIRKHIREKVIFANQNIISDPPFTKIDMICCRNVMIYLDAKLQKKVLPMFHYSLNPDGILVLGPSETVGQSNLIFEGLDKKWKIFKRKKLPAQVEQHLTAFPVEFMPRRKAQTPEASLKIPAAISGEPSLPELVSGLLLANFAPPSVVVSPKGDIIYIHGRTGKYLEPASGRATVNVMDMARRGMKAELAAAIRKAVQQKKETVYDNLKVGTNGGRQMIRLVVKPIKDVSALKGLILVTFEDVASQRVEKRAKDVHSQKHSLRVRSLEEELKFTKENLQTTVEELETSNEELKSANEELQSNNEELQSTNEELETSREELQSLNEELTTVNAELQGRIDQLSEVSDDMKNLLDSVDIAVIFLDGDLKIKRFTPRSKDIISLISSDIGRPISDIALKLVDVDLARISERVLSTLVFHEEKVRTKDGSVYMLRVMPYRTLANVIDGVVITLSDVTDKPLVRRLQRMAAVITDSNDAVTVHDLNGKITEWNKGAEKMYGYAAPEAMKMNISAIIPNGQRKEYAMLLERIKKGEVIESFRTKRAGKSGRVMDVWLTVTKLTGEDGLVDSVATTERDINSIPPGDSNEGKKKK